MIYKGYLPYALSIHVPYETAMALNPTKLEPFTEAFNNEQKMLDYHMWMMGIYVQDAVMVAVEKNLAGKKSKAKYFEKPLMEQQEEKNGDNLTQEQKHNIVENLFTSLQIRKANWDLEHKKVGAE